MFFTEVIIRRLIFNLPQSILNFKKHIKKLDSFEVLELYTRKRQVAVTLHTALQKK